MICGLPNSGKTTFSKQFSNVIHLDNVSAFRANDQFLKCNKLVASASGDVCVEGVYNTAKRRTDFLDVLKDSNGEKVCIWLDTPVNTCLEREKAFRKRPADIVLHHAKAFEPPTLDEGWDEIIIIRGDNEQRICRETET